MLRRRRSWGATTLVSPVSSRLASHIADLYPLEELQRETFQFVAFG